jgi:hypothetical protein
MHRSGTSCLAGSLEEAGLLLGDVNTAAPSNLKGNRENKRIMDLHNAVLEHNGGSWCRPPGQVNWTDAHREERDAIIQSYEYAPVWGFKDPRMLLLLEFWREAALNFTFVGSLRHPHLVAQSLFRRNGGSVENWLDVWAHYNRRLLALHEAAAFPVVRFDLGEAAYCRALAIVMDHLGLQAPVRMEFFDPILRHHETAGLPELPDRVSRLYESLRGIALEP